MRSGQEDGTASHSDVEVLRTPTLDSTRDLAFRGKYLGFSAYPDQYVTWAFPSVWIGLRLLRRERIDLIYSTFPTATTHLVGLLLHKTSGRPWVADFRDPMVQDGYPNDPCKRKIWGWLERETAIHARHLLFTAESARLYYLQRYPWLKGDRCHVVRNGFIESDFKDIHSAELPDRIPKGKIRIIHAGSLYPFERDPEGLFGALCRGLQSGTLKEKELCIEFYGAGEEQTVECFIKKIQEMRLEGMVKFFPAVPHHTMLQKMNKSDILLIMQGACCDYQIPAKVYEYFRIRKPILALTTESGDTGKLVRAQGAGFIAPMDKEEDILETLQKIVHLMKTGGRLPSISLEAVGSFSRSEQAKRLSKIFDECLTIS